MSIADVSGKNDRRQNDAVLDPLLGAEECENIFDTCDHDRGDNIANGNRKRQEFLSFRQVLPRSAVAESGVTWRQVTIPLCGINTDGITRSFCGMD